MQRKVFLASCLMTLCLGLTQCSTRPTQPSSNPTVQSAQNTRQTAIEAAFLQMSPAEHLRQAQTMIRPDSASGRLNEALRHLNAVPKESDQWREAEKLRIAVVKLKPLAEARETRQLRAEQRRLAAEQERKIAEEVKLRTETQRALRIAFAKQLENGLLDKGFDATVAAAGTNNTTLRIKWILVDRVMAHQMSKESGIFESAREIGFRRVEISDGYDAGWYWKLD